MSFWPTQPNKPPNDLCSKRCVVVVMRRARHVSRPRSPAEHHHHAHRSRARRHGGRYVIVDRRAIFERDGWTCQLCSGAVDPSAPPRSRWSATLDHVVPLSRGGDHAPENVQLAHLTCNSQKSARLPSARKSSRGWVA